MTRTGRTTVVVVGLCVALISGGSADARDVSRAELGDLAERARFDPDALNELRTVESVDGRPVDVNRALSGAQGDDLARRLDAIGRGRSSSGSGASARRQAEDILDSRKYRPADIPRPFAGLLRRIGRAIDRFFSRIGRALGRFFQPIADLLPGGWSTFRAIVAVIAIAIAALLAARLSRRRRSLRAKRAPAPKEKAEDGPTKLLRDAEIAESKGDHRTAIRLRFRAGLLRLDRAGAITFRPSITTGEVARTLRLAPFDDVARSFEEVTYGERPPGERDVELSRTGWDAVLRSLAA